MMLVLPSFSDDFKVINSVFALKTIIKKIFKQTSDNFWGRCRVQIPLGIGITCRVIKKKTASVILLRISLKSSHYIRSIKTNLALFRHRSLIGYIGISTTKNRLFMAKVYRERWWDREINWEFTLGTTE